MTIPGVYIDESIDLRKVDGIIFDCDGVLIDITKSYDSTITNTVQYVLEKFAKINDSIRIDHSIIDGFKSTGGFNDEVDLAYAGILSIIAAKKLQKDSKLFINNVINNANSTGIISVEKFLEKLVDISDIKSILDYPGPHNTNLLYQIFDQIFYGPELYFKVYGKKSNFSESGLINYDDVIINDSLIKKLQNRFTSKIALVTGRGKESVNYSLKNMLKTFDLKNSVFLEDESRSMAKPNPESLIRCISGMNSKITLYVGDSMEDFIMAKKATILGNETIFCGIIGTSKDLEKKLKLFQNNGAVLILDSINLIPKILNLE